MGGLTEVVERPRKRWIAQHGGQTRLQAEHIFFGREQIDLLIAGPFRVDSARGISSSRLAALPAHPTCGSPRRQGCSRSSRAVAEAGELVFVLHGG